MNILILAAGGAKSDASEGEYPLYLSEVEGALVLERVVHAFRSLAPQRFIFAFREADVRAFHVDAIATQLVEGATVLPISKPTAGAACTALLAIDHLDPAEELIIANATDLVEVDFAAVIASFRQAGAVAGTLSFESLHPRYSYVKLDAEGLVVEAAEKHPISRHATTGIYWFRRTSDFVRAAKRMIVADAHVGGQYYVCPTFNELILEGGKVMAWQIQAEAYHPLKSAQQVNTFQHALEKAGP